MELHPGPRPVAVAQGHDLALRSARRHFHAPVRRFGEAHHQRMVAPDGEGIGQPLEQALAVMDNVRLLAVHDIGRKRDVSPGVQAEQLVPEADAEHRHGRRAGLQPPEELRAKPGAFRAARTRRNADHGKGGVFRHARQGGIVIGEHHRFAPESVKRLHEVVGKGIVVIDEQEHGLPPRA